MSLITCTFNCMRVLIFVIFQEVDQGKDHFQVVFVYFPPFRFALNASPILLGRKSNLCLVCGFHTDLLIWRPMQHKTVNCDSFELLNTYKPVKKIHTVTVNIITRKTATCDHFLT